uniref:Ubiquitin-fold modifier-conjugating enzyme 1 n=1 Tax=Papio anubis TaxID=9555 RepID=A0A8I5NW22_PAPAN
MADEATRRVVSEIPVVKTNAGPRDRELWVQRLKEEYQSLIRPGPWLAVEIPDLIQKGVIQHKEKCNQ